MSARTKHAAQAALFLTTIVGLAEALTISPGILQVEYNYKFRTVRELSGFAIASFNILFDRNLTLAGQPLSSFTYEAGNASSSVICLNKDLCAPLPTVSTMLSSTVTVTCVGSKSESVFIDARWQSGGSPFSSWPATSRVPSFLIPMGGVSDATSALFHALGVSRSPDLARSSRRMSFLLFLSLAQISGDIPLRPSILTADSLSSCVFRINGTGSLLLADGLPVVLTSSTVKTTRVRPPCSYYNSQRTAGEIKRAIDSLELSQQAALSLAPWTIAAIAVSDPFWGCVEQAKAPVPASAVSRFMNSTACTLVAGTPEWAVDPCCNLTLSYTMCCLAHTIEQKTEVLSVTTVLDAALPAQCRFRDQVKTALTNLGSLLNSAENVTRGCSADAANNVNPTLFNEFFSFVEKCEKSLFPSGTAPNPKLLDLLNVLQPNSCTTNSDCAVGVTCAAGYCRTPIFTSKYEDLLVGCLIAQMPPIVRRLFQIKYKLPANQTTAAFRASFEANMFHDNCVGGWQAYVYNHDYSTSPPTYRLANRTKCEQYTVCSHDSQLGGPINNVTCPPVTVTGVTGFCASCPFQGYPCLNYYSEPAGCYQWLTDGDDGTCAKTGGTYYPRKSGCWYPQLNVTQCMPPSVCPKYTLPGDNSDLSGCLLSTCYSPQLNATTCNAASAKLACASQNPPCTMTYQWTANFAWGKGLCRHPRLTKAQCPGLFKEAMFWSQGVLNTPEKCKKGLCVVGNVLDTTVNSTDCVNRRQCSKMCKTCSTRNLLLLIVCTAEVNATECTRLKGRTDNTYGTGLCSFDLGKTACLKANYTYQRCSDLNLDECALCDSRRGNFTGCPRSKMTPLNSRLLGCGVPDEPNADCLTETDCVSAGDCDSEFANTALSSTFCETDVRGFFSDSRCAGVCQAPFVIDQFGQPTCPTYLNATLYKTGCHSKSISSQEACLKAGLTWKALPRTMDQCLASSGFGCFENGGGQLSTNKSLSECVACSPTVSPLTELYRPVTSWRKGAWVAGKVIPEDWDWRPRGPQKPLKWGRTLDRNLFFETLSDFAANRFGPFVKSELLCRYSPLASAVTPVSCSCDPLGPAKCFGGAVSVADVGAQRFCAGISDSVRMGSIFLRAESDTVPDSVGCLDFGVGLASSRQFLRDVASLSSTDISSITLGGAFSVIKNEYGATVGQMLSDGAQVTWAGSLNSPITICVDVDSSIPTESSRFSELDFALLQPTLSDTSSATFTPLDLNSTKMRDGQLCLSSRKAGTYFVIRRMVDWRDVRVSATSTPIAIRIFLGIQSVAFGLLCIFAGGSVIFVFVYSQGKWHNVSPQKIILVLIFILSALRCVWLALNAAEATSILGGVGTSLLSELPIFTAYSVFTTLIIFWVSSVGASNSGRVYSSKSMAIISLSVNVLLYLLYAGLLIGFGEATSDVKLRISIAYKGVLAGLSVVTVTAFWISGTRLLLLLKQGEDAQRRAQRLHMTVVVLVASMCLVGQVAFMLAGATIDSSQQQLFAWFLVFMFYTPFELVPFSILAHMLFSNSWHYRARMRVQSIPSSTHHSSTSTPLEDASNKSTKSLVGSRVGFTPVSRSDGGDSD